MLVVVHSTRFCDAFADIRVVCPLPFSQQMPERRTCKITGLKEKTGIVFMTDTGQPVFDSKTTAVGLRRFSPHLSIPACVHTYMLLHQSMRRRRAIHSSSSVPSGQSRLPSICIVYTSVNHYCLTHPPRSITTPRSTPPATRLAPRRHVYVPYMRSIHQTFL